VKAFFVWIQGLKSAGRDLRGKDGSEIESKDKLEPRRKSKNQL
jgi:hypothetical protein